MNLSTSRESAAYIHDNIVTVGHQKRAYILFALEWDQLQYGVSLSAQAQVRRGRREEQHRVRLLGLAQHPRLAFRAQYRILPIGCRLDLEAVSRW
jgi:hypothetical protein